MDDSMRDQLITEIHTDVAWLKDAHKEHKATHAKYFYYMVTIFVACVLSWFR